MSNPDKDLEQTLNDGALSVTNWNRPIWVASFNRKSNSQFGSVFDVHSVIQWTIEPYDVQEFRANALPDDPVVLQRVNEEDGMAEIIFTGRLGHFNTTNPTQKPFVEIQISENYFEKPLPYSMSVLNVPPLEDRPSTLHLLPERETLELSKWLDQHQEGYIQEALKTKSPDIRARLDAIFAPESPPTEPTPPPPINTSSQFNTDRPRSVSDTLRRAPNAFVVANYLNRLRGTPDTDADHDSYVLHVDAPWGGGKTTFANFIANFLSYSTYLTPKDQLNFIDTSGVPRERLEPMAANNWMILRFNAWENQHVTPPWWNFYTSFLQGYQNHIDHPFLFDMDEYSWRIFTPETLKSMFLAVILFLIALIAASFGAFAKADPLITTAAAFLGATSFIAYLFTQAKSGVKKIIDAADSAYNPTVLGETDPLTRLRKRFLKVAGYENRPVLMIIDDIDRCEPEYVVELMRGLITIFQSNHVSYLILGDRGWIEQSFENVNEDMADIHTDTSVGFGARFAEKVIQMSYLLPQIPDDERAAYLRSLLGQTEDRAARKAAAQAKMQELFTQSDNSEDIADLKSKAENSQNAANPEDALIETEAIRIQAAIARSAAEDQEKTIRHGLEEVGELLPVNPRRVKRLVNMIAVYQASGETTLGIDPDTREDWLPMVLWLILFSEHPNVHANLYRNPDLLKPLDPPHEDLRLYDWKIEGGLPRGARRIIKGIGEGSDNIGITVENAKHLRSLTPLKG